MLLPPAQPVGSLQCIQVPPFGGHDIVDFKYIQNIRSKSNDCHIRSSNDKQLCNLLYAAYNITITLKISYIRNNTRDRCRNRHGILPFLHSLRYFHNCFCIFQVTCRINWTFNQKYSMHQASELASKGKQMLFQRLQRGSGQFTFFPQRHHCCPCTSDKASRPASSYGWGYIQPT